MAPLGSSSAKKGTATGAGRGKTTGSGKLSGKTILTARRHRKILRDTINGITRPAIRRMARRGGVKRISALIYNDVREALRSRLQQILKDCVAYVEYRNAKTVTTLDVIHSLKRLGRPVYGFDPDTFDASALKKKKTSA